MSEIFMAAVRDVNCLFSFPLKHTTVLNHASPRPVVRQSPQTRRHRQSRVPRQRSLQRHRRPRHIHGSRGLQGQAELQLPGVLAEETVQPRGGGDASVEKEAATEAASAMTKKTKRALIL